ncbi:ABC transporter ATP-binding protein [Ahrensia sp. R2A130]|uniref:ABC transporter ATP-binding protein n=1 Tax=Ahrensia sp. R2A130 TaxID=744979 RepID=UPI0001E0C9D4|nr:ABC transporter ATP-binding protein [Ahrensia sp. R2A130]EFL89382.1 maltose/maltodextrin import ATP-binding protein MalK [Ahrensia sp. R2A130]
MLELKSVGKKVGNQFHITDVNLSLEKGSLNVLLGPTLSGKTSLMRLMAGLDRPTHGDILMDGKSVAKTPVQKRNVAMVYQQFINYPAFNVYENIASPLRVAGVDKATIDKKVREAADLLKLTPYLDRTVLNLSGGQQQRTALARALVKGAELVLLDEPLANLDYKLREELRIELPRIFAETGAIFVYATTEPHEALLLGGDTATLHEGRVTQFGKTIDVHNRPADLVTAQTFSDPPMNVVAMEKRGKKLVHAQGETSLPKNLDSLSDGAYRIGVRPHHIRLHADPTAPVKMEGNVSTSEIAGSETFVHLGTGDDRLVVLTHGVHRVNSGDRIPYYLNPSRFFVFSPEGDLVLAPASAENGEAA